MSIRRADLIHAIAEAQKNNDIESYNELLRIYYRMLSQEQIKDVFMKEITLYDTISNRALQLLGV